MPLFALYTGGKDSTLAIVKAIEFGYKVDAILSVTSENPYSYMFHTPNIKYTKLHAISMGMKHFLFKSSGEKDKELDELETILSCMKKLGYEGFVSGAVASRYQRNHLARLADKVGLVSVTPLWGKDQRELLYECIDKRIEFMITRVAAWGLKKDMLGMVINNEEKVNLLIKLSEKYGFNPTGEGGEYETFVLNAPNMRYKISVDDYEIRDEGDSATLIIKSARLIEK